jgi:uncharacterized membrane protein (UPF0127 family)
VGDWLCSAEDGRVLASVEMATERVARRVGLIGRPGLDGALFIAPTFAVHTMGVRFAIDVAFLDKDFVVLSTVRMKPRRVGWPRLRAKAVIEAEAGSFERWGLRRGDKVDIR